MEPTKIEETVVIEWWLCNRFPKHRHKTREIAMKCIAKPVRLLPNRWTHERMTEAAQRYVNGETFRAIGKSFGIGGGRISQVMWKFVRLKIPWQEREKWEVDDPRETVRIALERPWR